jgi:hypothetical protein
MGLDRKINVIITKSVVLIVFVTLKLPLFVNVWKVSVLGMNKLGN